MSFASDVRGELARGSVGQICCAKSELTAALLISGGISWRGRNRYALSLTCGDGAVIRHFFALLKQYWGITAEIRTVKAESLGGETRYQLLIPEDVSLTLLSDLQLLDSASLFGVRTVPAEGIIYYDCCKKSFLRGAFLMSGTVSNPEKMYDIEFITPTEEFAEQVKILLEKFEISAKKACRKSKFVVYCKRSEEISDALTVLGASKAMMQLETVRVKKDIGNRINRQMNCDGYNLARTTDAAVSQREDIELIERVKGLNSLPDTLRELAYARLDNESASITALGEMFDPPLTKSAVSARFRRIKALADKLREKGESQKS